MRRRRWRGRRGGRSSSWRQRRSFLSLTPCPLTSLQPITRGDSLPQAAVLQVCSTTPSFPPSTAKLQLAAGETTVPAAPAPKRGRSNARRAPRVRVGSTPCRPCARVVGRVLGQPVQELRAHVTPKESGMTGQYDERY